MIDKYKERGYKKLKLVCKITEKNSLMRQTLTECGLFEKEIESSDQYKLIHLMSHDTVFENIIAIVET